jgi:hydrogenase maturation protease
MEDRKNILVMGIGNILFKDEGIGIHVIEKLQTMDLPSDVELVDGGMASNVFLYLIEKREKVILIDAMKAGGSPGTIYRLAEKEFLEARKGWRTTQESEFEDAYRTATLTKTEPGEFVVIGIEPEETGEDTHKCEIGLSPSLETKIPEIIEMVMTEIK